MKFGPIEIVWRKKQKGASPVWHRPPYLPLQIGSMTLEQLRRELTFVRETLHREESLCIPKQDPFQRIHVK